MAKTKKMKAVGCGSLRLQSNVLVETPCTVPFCLENASKDFLLPKKYEPLLVKKKVHFSRFMDQIRGLIQVI